MAFDHQDETSEISLEKLFSKFERQPDPVIDSKIEQLPLHDCLTPDNFERLIARLADPADGMSVRAFRYGKSGSTQGGVDVMVIDATSRKCDYYEGKRWASIAKGDITAWVDKFLCGPHSADARKFVLCTTFNVFEVTELALEWKECAKLLATREIDGDLWDGVKIHTLLRRRRPIVSELFGDDVADRYCVQDFRSPPEPPKRIFETKRITQFGRSLSLENVTISCNVLMPSDDEMSTGAILSFARPDLSGITISISGKELVSWMQWRAHARTDEARPYAVPMIGDARKVVLIANSARLILDNEEIQHLDWVLNTAWASFYKTANEQLTLYRCGRFKRLRGSTGPFVLASVKRSLWRAMIEFAQEHDVAKGNGPWHIFDGAPGCLKVYTQTDTDRFDHGHHVFLYAYDEGGIWLPWETNVVIGWKIPADFGGAVDVSPRTNWDANFTHDWLLEEFIPEVLRWKSTVPQEQPSKPGFWSKRAAQQIQHQTVDISNVASSSAIGLSLRVVPDNFDGLLACVGALQSHFNGRRSDVGIEPALGKAVLTAIDRALTFAKLPYEGYLRGVLSIQPEGDLVDAVRAHARADTTVTSPAAMDYRLRGLLEVMNVAKAAPAGEWRSIAAMLQPVLDRYNEDVVCDLFMAE
ncbi:hypothetical protein [Azonexus sp. IMCC34839]|uniref:hypothetical protein n=1 Tax=Azonexus sp. IMCC34839 TaxID=3133695 RepID=UPI003999A9CD